MAFRGRRVRREAALDRRQARRERRQALGIAALLTLRRAHQLQNAGQPAEAATLFLELAQTAEAYAMPVRAAQLYLQTARSLAQAGARGNLLAVSRRAIDLLTSAGEMDLLATAVPRLIADLRARGYTAEADALQQTAIAARTTGLLPARPVPPTGRVPLPPTCPQCGGAVRSDEVEWIDDDSAECSYCGSVVQRGA